jgi:hypothetical protein
VSVTLDTMVLIWGGLQQAGLTDRVIPPEVADMQRRSRLLLRELEEERETQ